jgi:hypothetical protein
VGLVIRGDLKREIELGFQTLNGQEEIPEEDID